MQKDLEQADSSSMRSRLSTCKRHNVNAVRRLSRSSAGRKAQANLLCGHHHHHHHVGRLAGPCVPQLSCFPLLRSNTTILRLPFEGRALVSSRFVFQFILMFPTRGHLNSTSLRSAGRPPLCQSRRAEWSCRTWSRSVLWGDVSRRVARCQTHRVQICAASSCLLGVSSAMRRRRAVQSLVS